MSDIKELEAKLADKDLEISELKETIANLMREYLVPCSDYLKKLIS